MEFRFHITKYNVDQLEDEVATALDKQAELYSRKRFPAIWKFIDRINKWVASRKASKHKSIIRILYGIVMTVMGIILLGPGLMEPGELFLLLITGIISVTIGVGCLWPRRKQLKNEFDIKEDKLHVGVKKRTNRKLHKMAHDLLVGIRKSVELTTDTTVTVDFTLEGMSLLGNTLVAYQDFQTIIEGVNIYFLVWQDKVTILQKKDLLERSVEDFLTFLEEMTRLQGIKIGAET